ncbi:hypothetical protein ARMA_3006 [Ardenticatena maritima]|uniref:Uncharacterized protein n=1 Tax=Ardenticatena maritima TaxID=872965 RepID=A0A0M8K9J7_9CHLR|nr:hypothetical protein ARMA_3006 [Ardenticatena maritima]
MGCYDNQGWSHISPHKTRVSISQVQRRVNCDKMHRPAKALRVKRYTMECGGNYCPKQSLCGTMSVGEPTSQGRQVCPRGGVSMGTFPDVCKVSSFAQPCNARRANLVL